MIKIVFDGFAVLVLLIFIFLPFILYLIDSTKNFLYHITKCKAWAKVYTDYPDMLLDRKYKVKCKKHWWNKYKTYQDLTRKYDDDYLYSEALNTVKKIENGEIEI